MNATSIADPATAPRTQRRDDFGELVEPHLEPLYGYCVSLSDSPHDAEDLLQEALIRGMSGLPTLREPAKFRSWLFTIVTNTWRDRLRARGRRVPTTSLHASSEDDFSLFETLAVDDPFPYSDELHLDFLRLFRSADVRSVFREITPVHRMPLILTAVHGFSCKEAASILDVPLGTILSRLHRGRKQLEHGLWDFAVRNRLVEVSGDD
jgi:RNA polymerase sigma-70 factor (ECF subfamily)